ncbi:MAG: aminotransferase class I/II-fold pyridoxal phosphate-dependent enzyme [Opitutaceae bacterium]
MRLDLPKPYPPGSLRIHSATHVRADGRTLLFFAGSNYLGLTWHPALRRAMVSALKHGPLQPNGSRATTGEHRAYRDLEATIARFFGAEGAALVTNGYAAPIAACQALRTEYSHVLLDQGAHACVADGARLSGKPVVRFDTGNDVDLQRRLARLPAAARPLVATDGTFGVRGGVAPLDRYLAVLPKHGWLLVDDAHGGGTVGPGGRGAVALFGLRDPRIVQAFSLAKAFGVAGGAVVGTAECAEAVRTKASVFVGSTSMLIAAVVAAKAAVQLVAASPSRVRRLQANARLLHESLPAAPEIRSDPRTPATGVYPSSPAQAAALRKSLLAAGILPSWIRYLQGPPGGFFRFAVCSEHTPFQVRQFAAAVRAGLGASPGGSETRPMRPMIVR